MIDEDVKPHMERDLSWAMADLRHAYSHLVNGRVGDHKSLADGLISPAIQKMEKALASLQAESPPLISSQTGTVGRSPCPADMVERVADAIYMAQLSATTGNGTLYEQMARAAIAALPQSSGGWLPGTTAPMDGTNFIGAYRGCRAITAYDDGQWWGDGIPPAEGPEFWMPLPPIPKGQEG